MNFFWFLIQKNRERVVVLFVYTMLVTIFVTLVGFTLASVSYEKKTRTLLHNMDNWYTFRPYTKLVENLEEQNKFADVLSKAHIFLDKGIVRCDEVETDYGDVIFSCSELMASHLNWELAKGEVFTDDPNQVIVIENSGYEIGDKIALYSEDNRSECTVVGITKHSVFMSELSGWSDEDPNASDDFDGNPPYEYYYENYGRCREECGYGVLILNPRNPLVREHKGSGFGGVLYESFLYDSSKSDCKDSVWNEIAKFGDVESVTMLQNDNRSFWNRDETVLEICFLLLFICGLIVHNYLDTVSQTKEYGIYYMLGMTPSKFVCMILLKNIVPFMIGILLGAGFVFLNTLSYNVSRLFEWSNQLMVFLCMVAVYFLSMIPIVVRMKKKDPWELMMGKE